jgi:hypothetical protein
MDDLRDLARGHDIRLSTKQHDKRSALCETLARDLHWKRAPRKPTSATQRRYAAAEDAPTDYNDCFYGIAQGGANFTITELEAIADELGVRVPKATKAELGFHGTVGRGYKNRLCQAIVTQLD